METTWGDAAKLRREQIEQGLDITFSEVFTPFYLRVLARTAPDSVLEIGCGTGHLSKSIAPRVRRCVALEPSPAMFAQAREVLAGSGGMVEPVRVEEYKSTVGFDLIIAHLVLQMVEELPAFAEATGGLLSNRGVFVCSIPHPCFWNNYREYIPRDAYRYTRRVFVRATLMITNDPGRRITEVPYYHRPLEDYINAFAGAKLHLTAMDEIYPESRVQARYGMEWLEPRYVALTYRRCSDGEGR